MDKPALGGMLLSITPTMAAEHGRVVDEHGRITIVVQDETGQSWAIEAEMLSVPESSNPGV